MRIPHIINENTRITYEASPESLKLLGERERKLLSEDFLWDKEHCPLLNDLCVEQLKANFAERPVNLDDLPCPDRNYLLEILATDLELDLVVPKIIEEIYWKRRYKSKFEAPPRTKPKTWKKLVIEKHMQQVIEQAEPQHNDEDNMEPLTTLCAPIIQNLFVSELQSWKPPLTWDEEDIPEIYPLDHINFDPIFQKLPEVKVLDVVYGMNRVGDKFNHEMFKLTPQDCQRLGKAIYHLKDLRVLRLHRSKVQDQHVRLLMHGLIKNESIEELDLSHCEIGNDGALCIAKVLSVHPKIEILNLCDNKISAPGGEGIGFALLQENSSPIKKLDLRLNPLGHDGAMGVMRAIVRGETKPVELIIAGCDFDDVVAIRVGQMLQLNTSLKKLDVSNNWFDEEGGEGLVEGMTINKTLEWFDVRETDITREQFKQINKCLVRNRGEVEKVEEEEFLEIEDVEEEQESITESTLTEMTEQKK